MTEVTEKKTFMKLMDNTTQQRERQVFWKVILEFKTALCGEMIPSEWQCFGWVSDCSLHWA